MTTDDRAPGPLEPAREHSHPTVCGQPVRQGSDRPCVLRTAHPGPHEHLRDLQVYAVYAVVEPSSGYTCTIHGDEIPIGAWALILPDVTTKQDHGGLFLCGRCAGELARHALAVPTGPAPDPSETSDPADWH